MAIELPYFKFYTAEYDSGDISICSFEAQGLFTALCSLYWGQQGKVSLQKAKKRFKTASQGAWDELLSDKIIKLDGDKVTISFLDKQLEDRGKLAVKNKENIEKRWLKTPKTDKLYESNTSRIGVEYNIEEKRREEKREEIPDSIPVLDNSSVPERTPVVDEIDHRKQAFKDSVYEQGSTTYTKIMLDDFISYWSEPTLSRKKQKMRFELEKTWDLKRRFKTWVSRSRSYPCFLTDEQKTIEIKKREFAESLKPHLEKYGRTVLNEFYAYWTQPENKADPKFMRYEQQEFWDVSQRLASWKQREVKKEPNQEVTGYQIPRKFLQPNEQNTER